MPDIPAITINEVKKTRTSVVRQDVFKKALEKKKEKKLSSVQEAVEIPQPSCESLQCKDLFMLSIMCTQRYISMYTHMYAHMHLHTSTHIQCLDPYRQKHIHLHILHAHTLELLLRSITIHRSTIVPSLGRLNTL